MPDSGFGTKEPVFLCGRFSIFPQATNFLPNGHIADFSYRAMVSQAQKGRSVKMLNAQANANEKNEFRLD